MWRVLTLAPKPGSFEMRVPIKKEWRGLRDEELKKVSGFEDIEFVHNTGFIGGAWSLETVLKMAEMSLADHQALLKKNE